MVGLNDYEKLGVFYLGRKVDQAGGGELAEPLLYEARDLTTHAVILGMTGSGKTGLAVSLLEEALMDGVPVIAIDPKGDLGNLMLTFPDLRGSDFLPWVDESAAARAGETLEVHATNQAKRWKKGLAQWGQAPERIARLEAAAERIIYTPGSTAGRPLSILRSLDAPPPELLEDEEALRERIGSSVTGLLGLLGVAADPLQSREYILLSTLLDRAWREGRGMDMATLIHQIQKPPIERVGILELEMFYPASERFGLAMRLNNLLASPGFSAWLEGDPLDIGHLLRAPDGRPRLSILSIAHLSDAERMFVVSLVLGQLVSWMRAQSGSQSLRALLYMDEVFGYFPPTANPPSKPPMLTLLKQARAFGVGVVLATQNPVDLDYKGLSNAGTWFLGRLQTERDKARVIDGLEGAANTAAAGLDRAALDTLLSGLGRRTFLMNNVHEDGPVLLRTRWTLSYLSGPLSREQIKKLTVKTEDMASPVASTRQSAPAPVIVPDRDLPANRPAPRPVAPSEANERFAPITHEPAGSERLVYQPMLVGRVSVHHANATANVDVWSTMTVGASLGEDMEGTPWVEARLLSAMPELETEPEDTARSIPLPAAAKRAASYRKWASQLKTHVYREHPLLLWRCGRPKLVSRPGEEEGAFRGRVAEMLRDERDLKLEKLRRRYAPKLERLRDRIARAEDRVSRESEQYQERKMQTAISIGATVIGALFGRKLASTRSVGRATTAMRGASRTMKERGDIGRARALVEEYRVKLAELEDALRSDLETIEDAALDHQPEIESFRVNARKADTVIERLHLVWVPYRVDAQGRAQVASAMAS